MWCSDSGMGRVKALYVGGMGPGPVQGPPLSPEQTDTTEKITFP